MTLICEGEMSTSCFFPLVLMTLTAFMCVCATSQTDTPACSTPLCSLSSSLIFHSTLVSHSASSSAAKTSLKAVSSNPGRSWQLAWVSVCTICPRLYEGMLANEAEMRSEVPSYCGRKRSRGCARHGEGRRRHPRRRRQKRQSVAESNIK